jgi:KAP family P-loop domain
MEFVIFGYPEDRDVFADELPIGKTNQILMLARDQYVFRLGEPRDYTPPSMSVVLVNTTPTSPMRLNFQKIFVGSSTEGRERADVFIAGYSSDTINVEKDDLDIREDVQTLTAVMLAKEVNPPLAIGLFGDWGTGKSFFMKSMLVAAKRLADKSKESSNPHFCWNIVPIEFNAWHYADTNLWASLVSYILDHLAAFVTPAPTIEQQEGALLTELGSAKAVLSETEAEKSRTQGQIHERQERLQRLQVERQQKEVQLRDLQLSDLRTALSSNSATKKELTESLEQIGIPAALTNIGDLSRVLSDAYSLSGRIAALLVELASPRSRWFRWALLLLLIFVPSSAALLHHYFPNFLVTVSGVISGFTLFVGILTTFLGKLLNQVRANFERVEVAKPRA